MPEHQIPVERLEMKVGNKWVPVEINSELRIVRGRVGRPPKPRTRRIDRPVICELPSCKVRFLPRNKTHRYCCGNHRKHADKLNHRDRTLEIDRKRRQRARAKARLPKYEYVMRPSDSVVAVEYSVDAPDVRFQSEM